MDAQDWDAQDWDARYAAAEQWSDAPNALAAELLRDLPPGLALDVAAGEGRMALWLASLGWQVTALDFSATGLERGRERAEQRGLAVQWRVADATATDLRQEHYDLVLVLYLHLPHAPLLDVLQRSARAVAPGGRLLVLGHDCDNLQRGTGGPQDAALLYDVETLRSAAAGLVIERAEQVARPVDGRVAVDALLLARR